jgi:ubiquitin-activating enzyme E1
MFTPYVRNGTVKNVKLPVTLAFKSLKDTFKSKEVPFDQNLRNTDFLKMEYPEILHIAFLALDEYKL